MTNSRTALSQSHRMALELILIIALGAIIIGISAIFGVGEDGLRSLLYWTTALVVVWAGVSVFDMVMSRRRQHRLRAHDRPAVHHQHRRRAHPPAHRKL